VLHLSRVSHPLERAGNPACLDGHSETLDLRGIAHIRGKTYAASLFKFGWPDGPFSEQVSPKKKRAITTRF
jgi:hypothetical protein